MWHLEIAISLEVQRKSFVIIRYSYVVGGYNGTYTQLSDVDTTLAIQRISCHHIDNTTTSRFHRKSCVPLRYNHNVADSAEVMLPVR